MTNPEVRIARYGDGISVVAPAGASTVLEPSADLDVLVLEVAGAHLTWNLLAGHRIPAAVIHDVERAQEWLWAIYGESLAVSLHDSYSATVTPEPALPPLAVSAWRLAYAHWAARWWPASTLDDIPALDPALLDRETATLTEECESLVDGADAIAPAVLAPVETFPRADDYALAAGTDHPDGLVLARGVTGWDWRLCPPGLVDASERAVSWELTRAGGTTTLGVNVAAAPNTPAEVPAYLMPWARAESSGATVDIPLRPRPGAWFGEAPIATTATAVHVTIHVPGFGVGENRTAAVMRDPAVQAVRRRIREFALARLRYAAEPPTGPDPNAYDVPLLAEIAASAQDSDF
ncbi:hypothetical protein [Nocardia sp. NPDC050406]|uniref:hypothetical protein n=1 Tax=Nocardia sp. NPDC050406 TaxID=3364318 RepID=UPI00379D49DD